MKSNINGSAHSIQALLGATAADNTTSTVNTTNKALFTLPTYVQAAVAGESGLFSNNVFLKVSGKHGNCHLSLQVLFYVSTLAKSLKMILKVLSYWLIFANI